MHLRHQGIVPGAIYQVQIIHELCDETNSADYSAPLTVATGMWGDAAGSFDPVTASWTRPDGRIDIGTDVLAIITRFSNSPGAPGKPLTDLAPASVNLKVDLLGDILQAVDAFRGLPYPYDGPEPCP